MDTGVVIAAIAAKMDTSDKLTLADALYDCASEEFKRAHHRAIYFDTETLVNSASYRYHMDRWQEYKDYAEIVDSMLPRDVLDSPGFQSERGY